VLQRVNSDVVTGCWPLTGRDSELARAVVAVGKEGGALLAGPGGVGRSRMAREVLRRLGRSGRTGRWLAATEAARGIPLGAFAPLMTGGSGPADAAGLARAAAALGGRAGVLVVDDAQLLDEASAALLHTLAVSRSVDLVVTVRGGEMIPDAVTALWKDDLIRRIELNPLEEPDIAALLRRALGSPLDMLSARWLHRATLGNLLWLRHLVEGERAAGRLVERAGRWRWTGQPRITPVLAELIASRFGPLDPGQRAVLELLAFDEAISADLVTDTSSVVELARRGLVEVDSGRRPARLRLAHPLYGPAVRAGTNPVRAWQLRGQLAEALAADGASGDGQPPGDALRRAVLTLDGNCPADPVLLTEAAATAASLADLPLARRLLEAATENGGGFEPRLALGMTLAWTGRRAEADAQLAETLAGATTGEERVRGRCAHAVVRYFQHCQPGEAVSLLDDAERGGTGVDPAGVRAAFAAADNRLDRAATLSASVLDAPAASGFATSWAGCAALAQRGAAGSVDRIEEFAEHLIAVAGRSAQTAMLQFALRYLQVYGLGLAGLLYRAGAAASAWDDIPGEYAVLARDALAARVALDSGRVADAAELYEANRTRLTGSAVGWTPIFEAANALALGMAGDPVGARQALSLAEQFAHPGIRLHEPELALARAWASAAEGAVAEAITEARGAARLAGECGQHAVEVLARHSAVRFGATDETARLEELAGLVVGPRAPVAAAHAAAVADDDPDALLAVSAQLERHELMSVAADAAAQAAVRLRARGATTQATFAVARASRLAGNGNGARTPALLAGVAPLEISCREREVATLAATGLSNRQIAERLFVSVRTVEGHVYRACTRLGLPDRAALAALVKANSATVGRSIDQFTQSERAPARV
jgi:DNA-binding NarL/FixJ family response regulator